MRYDYTNNAILTAAGDDTGGLQIRGRKKRALTPRRITPPLEHSGLAFFIEVRLSCVRGVDLAQGSTFQMLCEQPSLVLFRRQGQRRAAELAALLDANLNAVVADLDAGAVVVIDADRVRIRRLPLRPT